MFYILLLINTTKYNSFLTGTNSFHTAVLLPLCPAGPGRGKGLTLIKEEVMHSEYLHFDQNLLIQVISYLDNGTLYDVAHFL